jgi:hypothetical protein
MNAIIATLENCLVKILALESENGRKILDPNPKKINSDPQHWVVPTHFIISKLGIATTVQKD